MTSAGLTIVQVVHSCLAPHKEGHTKIITIIHQLNRFEDFVRLPSIGLGPLKFTQFISDIIFWYVIKLNLCCFCFLCYFLVCHCNCCYSCLSLYVYFLFSSNIVEETLRYWATSIVNTTRLDLRLRRNRGGTLQKVFTRHLRC